YRYASNPHIIHCPGDPRAGLPVNGNADNTVAGFGFSWASYSGAYNLNGGATSLLITKATQLLHPSERFVFVEECDSRGDNESGWGMMANPAANGDPGLAWLFWDSPAAFH